MPYHVHSDPHQDDHWARAGESAPDWDRERWCQGPCMDSPRRRADTYERDAEAWQEAVQEWEGAEDRTRRGPRPEEPEPPRFIAVDGTPVFCGLCKARIRQALVELDDMACLYAAQADGHRGVSDEPHVSGSTSRASLSPTVEDLDELDGWLRQWRATQAGVETWARAGMLAQSITTQVAWILHRLDVMLAREFAGDFGRETLRWHARLGRASKSDVVVQRKPLRCPGCQQLSLEWRQGDPVVTCSRVDCRTVLPLAEYEVLVGRETNGADRYYGRAG